MRISVLGCGRFGSFIAWYLSARRGLPVTLWGRPGSRNMAELKATRRNEYVTLPEEICLSEDLAATIREADAIIVSIKAQALRDFSAQMAACGATEKPVILCMKGLEEESGLRLTEVMAEGGYAKGRLAVWVGPGHIQAFTAGQPNCMLIDGYEPGLVHTLADAFKSPLIRFYYGDDIIGSEVGAAAKNVMGIVAGVLDGAGLSSLKGALMARGAREVARLIGAMGGKEQSAYGLCHLGDYEATLFSPYSNNRRFGEALARGEKFEKLAEGVATTRAMHGLGRRYGVELPITEAAYRVLYEGADPLSALSSLFERKTVTEFWR